MIQRELTLSVDKFALKAPFVIAGFSRTHVEVVSVTLRQGPFAGQGECVANRKQGQNNDDICREIEACRALIEAGATRQDLLTMLPAGPARAGLDAAMWHLEAAVAGQALEHFVQAGASLPERIETAVTISLDRPGNMAREAAALKDHPLLKLKLGGGLEDGERMLAVRGACPASKLIVDANESWQPEDLPALFEAAERSHVEMIEQPVHREHIEALGDHQTHITLCADESFHGAHDLEKVRHLFQMVNLKLDKTGGLTQALTVLEAVKAGGLEWMVGCMLGTSLAMRPALLLTPGARFVDLDAPFLLREDRPDPLLIEKGYILGGSA